MLSASGLPPYRMVFGSNSVDSFGREDSDEDLMFAQGASLAGQFAQPWKLRMRAWGATLKEIANSKLRRPSAHNETFKCAELDVGDMLLFYTARNRKSSPRWGGPAEVLEIDESGVTVSCQSQDFKVARYRVRQRMKNLKYRMGRGRLP